MAQFDVYRNKGPLKDTVPYVVVVQSSLFDGYRRRVVVPLVKKSRIAKSAPILAHRMNPVFRFKGMDLVLHPLDMVSVSIDQLGDLAGSLSEQGQAIADALDELLTRTWN